MIRALDRRDTTVLKGLAIAAIVFHNFFHFVSPARQNEFTFDPARFPVFLHTVVQPDLAIQAIFSFFGHFGVQVFVFLSAYGLSMSHWDDPAPWARFLWGRVKKLYPAMGLVVLPWFLAVSLHLGSLHAMGQIGLELVLMFLGLSTLLGYGLPPVGPWWFIPFVVQFYALWPLLRWMTNRFGWRSLVALAGLSMIATAGANPILAHWSINLFMTPVGRMPVLCFGILAARYPIQLNRKCALVAAMAFVLGCRFADFWPFTFIAALWLALWMYIPVRGVFRNNRYLLEIGRNSMLIFMINGIVRDQFVRFTSSPASQLFFGCVSAVVSFLLAALLQYLMHPKREMVGQANLSYGQ